MISSLRGQWVATLELLTAAAFWGFGFVAAVWALEELSPFQLTFTRFFIAGLIGLGFLFRTEMRQAIRDNLRVSLIPALLLAGTLVLQTVGLQYTTATKSGFITTLYVVFVPVMDWLVKGRRLPPLLWLCVFTALVGTGLIVNIGLTALNYGDLITLVCAVFAAAQIQVLGEVSPHIKRPFVFNTVQAGWAALVCLPLLIAEPFSRETFDFANWSSTAILGVLSLAFGSTVLAFYLQVRAQAKLSTTVSSLLFILESPFAMLFAVFLLGERLGLIESLGAFLIFLSAAAATYVEARSKK